MKSCFDSPFDGMTSVAALTDESGAVTTRYPYMLE